MDHHGATGPSLPARWWGPTTNVANADVMNQLCRVCGEPAAGFHFGAFTCEGCKSFFGRTYNNLSSVSECKNNGECVINKKNRTSCKACRLRKCLLVGMSKSGSRYGRRSNWFKIHCLLQEQQLQHQHQQQQHLSQTQTSIGVGGGGGGGLVACKKSPWEFACSKTAALQDIDNNNAPSADSKSESPPPLFPTGASMLVKSSNDSSSFWSASRPPFSVPHQHALPYLISPFLQSPLQPVSQNYLLPFLPLRPPPLPLEPLVITSASSPPASSLHSSSGSPTAPSTPSKEPTSEADTSSASTASLEQLRSLGPMQEQPIDLSSSMMTNSRTAATTADETKSKRERYRSSSPDRTRTKCAIFERETTAKAERKCDTSRKGTIPLDLTRSKS